MIDDILANFSDQELRDTAAYNSLIQLLEQIKLVHGGQGLQSTLKRHKKIYNFLVTYQKKCIIDIESNISGVHYISPEK